LPAKLAATFFGNRERRAERFGAGLPRQDLAPKCSRTAEERGVMFTLLSILDFLLNILAWIIIIQAIFSWLIAFNVINTYNQFVRSVNHALTVVTDPLYRPIRRFLPDMGGIDFSPLVVLIIIKVLQIIIRSNMMSFI
jgi:YggT family protein